MPVSEEKKHKARNLIAGGFVDFFVFLTSLPDPIIIGMAYPRTKLMAAFNSWAKSRNFYTDEADVSFWRDMCGKGLVQKD